MIVPLPSLIPGLLARPFTPFNAGSRERLLVPTLSTFSQSGPSSGSNKGLGSASTRTPKTSESNCRGQNTTLWCILYIIGMLLKSRCLNWACMTHLDICNTSYGKKKGRESNWQYDSWTLKIGNWPDPVRVGGVQRTVGKILTRAIALL